MAESCRCSQCGAEVPRDAPQGLCPNCVLGAGFRTSGSLPDSPSTAGSFDARFVPPTPAELAPLFPDLEILELVGQGGMGVVYRARQKQLDRLVALKILSPKIAQDPAFAGRFNREARAMAKLSHPHIVAVYDFGQTGKGDGSSLCEAPEGPSRQTGPVPFSAEAGLYYFLMEFVDGMNLRRLLDVEKLSPQEAFAIVPQICDALQYAHDAGVVHRDIKPENLLLDKTGRVKIADFGLAKLMFAEGDGSDAREAREGPSRQTEPLPGSDAEPLTRAGQVMGTPQYMAPEQRQRPAEVDHRADIYSLGVVFYQMLTGELPVGRFAPPSKKVQIDVRLDEVVLRALEKEPERRYQQASEIKTRVETIVATPPGKTGHLWTPILRVPLGGLVFLLAAFWTVMSHDIAAIRFQAPISENVFRPDKAFSLSMSAGLLSLAIAIFLIKRRNVVRVVLSVAVVWLLLLCATMFAQLYAMAEGIRSLEPSVAPPTAARSVKLQYAEEQLKRVEARHQAGMATAEEVRAATRDRDVAAAEMKGDVVAVARVKLRYAEERLKAVEARHKVGLATSAEVRAAKRDRDLAAAELADSDAIAPKPSTDAPAPKTSADANRVERQHAEEP